MSLNEEVMLKMYRYMVLGRMFEERVEQLAGPDRGDVFPSADDEFVAVHAVQVRLDVVPEVVPVEAEDDDVGVVLHTLMFEEDQGLGRAAP